MKKTSDFKSKILLSSSASILLGLVLSNTQLVKADNLSSDQVSTSKKDTDQNNQSNSSQAPTTSTVSPDEAKESNSVNTTDPQVGSIITNNTDSPTGTNSTRASTQPDVITGQITGTTLQVSYDLNTEELSILGGTYRKSKKGGLYSKYLYSTTDRKNYTEFRDAKKIKIVGKVDTDGDLSKMFADFSELTEIEGLNNLDTSNATKMSEMFAECYSLTSLDVSSFSTSKVTDMSLMFSSCSELKEINLSNLDTSSVTNMSQVFAECTSLTTIDLSSLDTSKVTTMWGMFESCTALTSVNLSNLNTSSVTNMEGMFEDCSSLSRLDLSSFDTRKVKELSDMFKGAKSLVDVNLSSFTFEIPNDHVNIVSMEGMFRDCSSLVNLDLSSFKTHRSVEVDGMFRNCSSLKYLNIQNFDLGCLNFNNKTFEGVTNQETLVLGKRTALANVDELDYDPDYPESYKYGTVGLNVPGLWVNVGSGTIDNPEASTRWTSYELMKNRAWFHEDIETGLSGPDEDEEINPDLIAETYVRKACPVTIHYQDEKGNAIKKDDVHFGRIGENYSFSAAKISGYELKADSQSTLTGQYDAVNERAITFVYSKVKDSAGSDSTSTKPDVDDKIDIVVHYQDENGNTLAADDILSGKIGNGYVSTAKKINGYELKFRPNNAVGFFNRDSKSIIYVYSKVNTDSQENLPEIATNDKSNHQRQKTRHPKITETSYHKVNKFENNTPKNNAATAQQLPKTGKSKIAQLLTTALGLISVASASALVWTKRKKD